MIVLIVYTHNLIYLHYFLYYLISFFRVESAINLYQKFNLAKVLNVFMYSEFFLFLIVKYTYFLIKHKLND